MRRAPSRPRRLLLGVGLTLLLAFPTGARAEDEAPPPPAEDGSVPSTAGEEPASTEADAPRPYAERHRLEGHTSLVRCVAFRPGTHVLASGGSDRSIRLWDTDAGAALASVVLPRGG